MLVLKILFWVLVVYAVVLFFSAFAKVKGMMKLAKMKLGQNGTDKKAIKMMYISAAALAAAAVVVGLFAFGVF